MGIMVQGKWRMEEFSERNRKGSYVRATTAFRNWIGGDDFPAETDRYHLIVAHACPWAHRTMIFRALKGLEDGISAAFVEPLMMDNGWEFSPGGDPLTGAQFAHQIYAKAAPDYSGRCSVPILWDKKSETIVSNESSEIIRMLNSAFNHLATNSIPDLYPEDLRAEINAVNEADFTALHAAAFRGLNEVVQYLVEHGADIDARDFRGRTAFRIAEGAKQSFQFQAFPETADLLRSLGANTRLGIPGTVHERADREVVQENEERSQSR